MPFRHGMDLNTDQHGTERRPFWLVGLVWLFARLDGWMAGWLGWILLGGEEGGAGRIKEGGVEIQCTIIDGRG